ncbi:unnamed protein product, partial [Calicophoron daubneyi]
IDHVNKDGCDNRNEEELGVDMTSEEDRTEQLLKRTWESNSWHSNEDFIVTVPKATSPTVLDTTSQITELSRDPQ